jgi:hypothetical protein
MSLKFFCISKEKIKEENQANTGLNIDMFLITWIKWYSLTVQDCMSHCTRKFILLKTQKLAKEKAKKVRSFGTKIEKKFKEGVEMQ